MLGVGKQAVVVKKILSHPSGRQLASIGKDLTESKFEYHICRTGQQ